MKLRLSMLSLLVLVALVISACGGAAPTAAPSAGSDSPAALPAASSTPKAGDAGSEMQHDAGTAMPADSTGAMEDDSNHAMPAETGSEMQNDAGTAMPADSSGAMEDDSNHAMPADAGSEMQNDAGTAMPADSSGAMEDDSNHTMPSDAGGEMQNDAGTAMPADSTGAMDAQTAMDLPAWFSAQLTDVNTGQTFTIGSLQGKVVLVETMAVWCSNCLKQQKEVKALHEAMGMREDFATVVLDVDPNENAANLSAYTARNGFDWTYAVAPRDVAREIGQLYGDQFLNPPSTPMLIVDRHGEAHPLPFGIKDAGTLQDALAPFLDGGM